MTDQPEALRVAQALESDWRVNLASNRDAARLLREQHAEIQELREANETFGKRQEWWNEKMFDMELEVERLRNALYYISLASQNSMSSQEECGRIAREALEGET